MLPSLMSRLAPAAGKGTALGIYNTFQFLGVFAGGIVGGLIYGVWGVAGVYGFAACAVFVWLVLALSTSAPALLESLTLRLADTVEQEQKDVLQRLSQVPGVREAVTLPGRDLVYLKVDPVVVDEDALREIDGVVAVD
jgi:MFS family permease